MLTKTHLSFAILFILFSVSQVSNKIVFCGMVLLGTLLLDIDSKESIFGRIILFRPLQFLVKHRGFIHSLTFAIIVSAILAVYYPILALGFFVGACLHLLLDSLTKEGVAILWPFQFRISGLLKTGGKIEEIIFLSTILLDVTLFFVLFVFR